MMMPSVRQLAESVLVVRCNEWRAPVVKVIQIEGLIIRRSCLRLRLGIIALVFKATKSWEYRKAKGAIVNHSHICKFPMCIGKI